MKKEKRGNFYEKLEEDIILSSDEDLRKRLELKFEEYKRRIPEHILEANKRGKNLAYTAPEIVSGNIKDANFKIKVLDKLLKDGRVRISDFERDIVHDEDRTYLKNAFGVIKSYVEFGGEHVTGGTGLPEVED